MNHVGEASPKTLHWDGHDTNIAQTVAADILSQEALHTVRYRWLPKCIGQHHRCRRRSVLTIARDELPSRLVLVEKSKKSENSAGKLTAKLVITKNIPDSEIYGEFRYLTLSHSWGKQEFFTMNAHNERECQESIDMDRPDFNKTFKQAIMITNLLGYRYIWIDSLCIIQSGDDGKDWKKECPLMGNIYKNSDLNLAASGFADGAEGLVTETRKYIVPPTITTFTERKYLVFYYEDPSELSPTWDNWALERRGWVLQENMLVSDGTHVLVR